MPNGFRFTYAKIFKNFKNSSSNTKSSQRTYHITVDILTQRNTAFGHELTLRDIFNFIGLDFDDKFILSKFGFSSLNTLVDDPTLHSARKLVAYMYPEIEKAY